MMRQRFLTALTEQEETYSGGLSQVLSGPLSAQETSNARDWQGDPYAVLFEATIDHWERKRVLRIEGTDEAALNRVLCCALISTMTEEGLPEALSSLNEIIEFYSHLPSSNLPDRASVGHDVVGQVASVMPRHHLVIDE